MDKEVNRLATKDELAAANEDNFFIKMTIEFGPKFSKKSMTNGEFLALLRKHSKHWKGFIGPMLAHLAEHIELSGAPEDAAEHILSSVYYGCGSCYTDGQEGSLCTVNGVTTCDAVC